MLSATHFLIQKIKLVIIKITTEKKKRRFEVKYGIRGRLFPDNSKGSFFAMLENQFFALLMHNFKQNIFLRLQCGVFELVEIRTLEILYLFL